MTKLDEEKGLQIGETYRNDKAAQAFAEFIALDARRELISVVKDRKFVSVITDGATDSSISAQEIVYIRTAKNGTVKTFFCSIEKVGKCDGEGIVNAIFDSLASLELNENQWTRKLVGFGSDGATVNLGKKSGVITRLKEKQPWPVVQGIHCHAHRLELAYKDAVNKNCYHEKVEALLTGLYYFYRNSPLNRSNLETSCKALNIKFLVPTRIGGTRWLPHWYRALENLWKIYPALATHLQQASMINIKSVLLKVICTDVVHFVY